MEFRFISEKQISLSLFVSLSVPVLTMEQRISSALSSLPPSKVAETLNEVTWLSLFDPSRATLDDLENIGAALDHVGDILQAAMHRKCRRLAHMPEKARDLLEGRFKKLSGHHKVSQ